MPVLARRAQRLRWGWAPLLLTALLRAVWLRGFPVDPLAPVDAEGFHLLASNLLDGHGFAIAWEAPFCPTAIRTPLYPLFIAAVYRGLGRVPDLVVLCQILLEVLTTAGVVALALELGRRRDTDRGFWPLLPGALYAINGTTQRFTGTLLSETLLLPLLTAAVLLTLRLLRKPRAGLAVGAGLAWGLVVLTKPNAQYLALAVAGLVVVHVLSRAALAGQARQWAITVAFCGALALTLAPWVLRNVRQFDRFILSTAFEENVARVSAVAVRASLSGVEAEPWTPTWEHLYREAVLAVDPAAVVILSPAAHTGTLDVPCSVVDRTHRELAAAARKLVAGHLGLYARLHLEGVVRSLLDPGHRFWYRLVTGQDWSNTGVIARMAPRIAWSLRRGAWGDAVAALWQERVARIPLNAGLLWWGLGLARLVVAALATRALVRLRSDRFALFLLLGTLAYHILLPGPIAHDRFYAPVVPLVTVLVGWEAGRYNSMYSLPARWLGGQGRTR